MTMIVTTDGNSHMNTDNDHSYSNNDHTTGSTNNGHDNDNSNNRPRGSPGLVTIIISLFSLLLLLGVL